MHNVSLFGDLFSFCRKTPTRGAELLTFAVKQPKPGSVSPEFAKKCHTVSRLWSFVIVEKDNQLTPANKAIDKASNDSSLPYDIHRPSQFQ